MNVDNPAAARERRDAVAPPAQSQTSVPDAEILHSANVAVIVERVGQVRAGCLAEARAFAREAADRINSKQAGTAGVFVYEETFGVRDRLHFLMHLTSLDAYYELLRMEDGAGAEADALGWNRLFVEGSVHDTVLMPQFWGMYGTAVDGELEKQSVVYRNVGPSVLPPARQQTSLPMDQILHSGNSGILMHRSVQMVSEFRSDARKFGREVAESINKNLPGECTVFVYEEAFGQADRLHWLIHLRDLTTYMRLLELHVRDEEVRDIYFKEWIAAEKGGGTWARMFIDGAMADVALTALR